MGDMVIRMSDVDEAYAIIDRQRVRAVSSSEMPTVDDYRQALIQCVVDKAHDWRVACESAEAASKEIGQLKAEIASLRLTDAELEDIRMWRTECQRQCGGATDGGDQELAERWSGRAERAAQILTRSE